ncbi:MAG: anthranilate synthase component I, partial [Natronococcus sp.]
MSDPERSPTASSVLDVDREAFREFAESDESRPVVVRAVAELEVETSPLSAYAALTGRSEGSDRERSPYAFLLESAEKTASSDPDGAFRPNATRADRHARYSYVGYDPEAVVT